MDVIELIRQGDIRATARLMRDLDEGEPQAREMLKELYKHTGQAHIVGITGSPGVGKSTLTDRLIQHLRQQGKTVGVVASEASLSITISMCFSSCRRNKKAVGASHGLGEKRKKPGAPTRNPRRMI